MVLNPGVPGSGGIGSLYKLLSKQSDNDSFPPSASAL